MIPVTYNQPITVYNKNVTIYQYTNGMSLLWQSIDDDAVKALGFGQPLLGIGQVEYGTPEIVSSNPSIDSVIPVTTGNGWSRHMESR